MGLPEASPAYRGAGVWGFATGMRWGQGTEEGLCTPADWQAAWLMGAVCFSLSLPGTLQNPGEGDKHAHQLPKIQNMLAPVNISHKVFPKERNLL